MPSRYDAKAKAKAIRRVREHAGGYSTAWAVITAVAGRLGMSAETVRKWLCQAGRCRRGALGYTEPEDMTIRTGQISSTRCRPSAG